VNVIIAFDGASKLASGSSIVLDGTEPY
jgi:hypothetical protein